MHRPAGLIQFTSNFQPTANHEVTSMIVKGQNQAAISVVEQPALAESISDKVRATGAWF
jgi:hypothetical protein